jgi:predicted nucleic acid-binding protein
MSRIFVDTWFFIASVQKSDSHHDAVLRLARAYYNVAFFTHDGVLTELLAFFAGRGRFWRESAAGFVRQAMAARKYKVTPLSRELFESALALYEDRRDKEYSLVDCTSMHLMRMHDITHVLTNDHHFRQEGFTVLSDAP